MFASIYGQAFGAKIIKASKIMHGKTSRSLTWVQIFKGLNNFYNKISQFNYKEL